MSPSTVLTKEALYSAAKWRGAHHSGANHRQSGTARYSEASEWNMVIKLSSIIILSETSLMRMIPTLKPVEKVLQGGRLRTVPFTPDLITSIPSAQKAQAEDNALTSGHPCDRERSAGSLR